MTVIHHRPTPVVSHDRIAWEYFGIRFYKKKTVDIKVIILIIL